MNNILITEGSFDEQVISRMLPDELMQSLLVTSRSGDTAALSAARSYYVDGGYKIVLFVDSDSNNEQEIASKQYEYEEMINSLGRRSSDAKVVLINPEIEALFFEDKNFIERIFEVPLDNDLTYDFLRKDPVSALLRLAAESNKIAPNQRNKRALQEILLKELDDDTINSIRTKNPQVQEIITYFQQK